MIRLAPLAAVLFATTACDKLPATTAKERTFRSCESALIAQLDAPSTYKRLWADYTARGPITKAEFITRLEQVLAREQPKADAGDFGAKLALYNIRKVHKCAKQGIGCKELEAGPSTSPGELPVAVASGDGDNEMIYEKSSLAKADGTSFVLIEYQANNQFNAPIRAYHFCRMQSESTIYLDGPIPLPEGDAAKKQYEGL